MYYVFVDRSRLLDLLPKRALVAEIGVAEGEFAAAIIERTQPMRLHLIDSWRHLDDPDYLDDANNVADAAQEARFQAVAARFAAERGEQRVELHRALAAEAAAGFRDGYFDWIYLDANHSFAAVQDDLARYDPKVRSDGLICGHDYCDNWIARGARFGVVPAVNAFVRERGYELLLITAEPFPSFVIAKQPDGRQRHELVQRLMLCGAPMVELPAPLDRPFETYIANRADGRDLWLGRFG